MTINSLTGKFWIVFIAFAALFLVACDGKDKSAPLQSAAVSFQPVIPKEFWGDYHATQASYNMRYLDGGVLRINGQPVRVPATRNVFTFEGNRIRWVQEAVEGRVTDSVRYEPGTPGIVERSGDQMLIECEFLTPDGRSQPTLRFRCDLRSGGIVLLGDRGSADADLHRR